MTKPTDVLQTWIHGFGAVICAVLALAGCVNGSDSPEGTVIQEAEHVEGEPPEVTLDSAALAMTDVRTDTARVVDGEVLGVTGSITYDENRVSHIGPRVQGRVTGIRADLGADVEVGQVLAVLESPEVGALRAELREGEALLTIQRENYERESRLEAQGISSRRELLDAEAELRRVEAAVRSAADRLAALGAGEGDGGEFSVVAPFAGVVVDKHATLGEVAGPSSQLFTVADLSRLWIELEVFERDLRRVSIGLPVSVSTAAYPGRSYSGRIVYVADVLDVATRTVRARVEVENPDRSLKPGMFATAEIVLGNGEPVVVVPRDAVQDIEGLTVVWVPGSTPGRFLGRAVQVGAALPNGSVQILSGLAPGELVVVEGAFTLKAELSRGEFGGHAH